MKYIFQIIYNQGGDYRRQCGQGVGSEKGKNVDEDFIGISDLHFVRRY